MGEFRPSVDNVHGGGRNLEFVDANAYKTVSDLYGGGRTHVPSYDLHPTSYHRNGVVEVKHKKPSKKFSSKTWWNDPETKRKKRVAKYKFYSVEGKVKTSIKRGYRWFKRKCSKIVHGL